MTNNKLILIYFLSILLGTSCSSDSSDTTQEPINPTPNEKETSTTSPNTPSDNDTNTEIAETNTGIKHIDGGIIFEPEITTSDLGKWVVRKPGDPNYYNGGDIKPLNNSYLEFTGNNLNGGKPTSPLVYKFVCKKTARYRLIARMYQPLKACTPGTNHCSKQGFELGDKRNDIYIKLTGDYTTDGVFPLKTLQTDHKFFGRGVRKWGSLTGMEAHVDGKKKLNSAFYNLKAGEEYTFTISGRAQGCSIDYFIFYDTSKKIKVVQHDDPAVVLAKDFQPDVTN